MHAESAGRTTLHGQPITSSAGAMGLMQVMPRTYSDLRKQLGLGADPYAPADNITAGAAYLQQMYRRYGYPGMFAAYNAGPGNIGKARTKAAAMGFDPNRWFQNVELGAAQIISREPVRYVRNIYKYCVAYRLLSEQADARRTAKGAAKSP